MGISKIIGVPLGFVMYLIYQVVPNYGVALFVFTLMTRLIMVPMSITQQKNSAKMAVLQPRIKAIQAKYQGNQQLTQEKLSELYQKENYNPMSGCLPMFIQLPILYGLIEVIYNPLTHILRLPATIIAGASKLVGMLGVPVPNVNLMQLGIVNSMRTKPAYFAVLGVSTVAAVDALNLNFLGMNLITQPDMKMITGAFSGHFDPVILIPIISGITSYFSMKITMKNSAATTGDMGAAGGMMKSMNLVMPVMSLMIAFSVPAGVGLYWVYSNVLMMVQAILLNKFFNPVELREKAEAEQKEKDKLERKEREEAKKKQKEGLLDPEDAHKALSQKEIDRMKLAQARKRDAEKYGYAYSENDSEE